jgi:hypothetical protein
MFLLTLVSWFWVANICLFFDICSVFFCYVLKFDLSKLQWAEYYLRFEWEVGFEIVLVCPCSGSFTLTSDRRGMAPVSSALPMMDMLPQTVLQPTVDVDSHQLETIPRTGKTPWPQKPCIVCKGKGILRKSRYHCVGCVRQPGFCNKRECFSDFHYHLKYPINSSWNVPFEGSDHLQQSTAWTNST